MGFEPRTSAFFLNEALQLFKEGRYGYKWRAHQLRSYDLTEPDFAMDALGEGNSVTEPFGYFV